MWHRQECLCHENHAHEAAIDDGFVAATFRPALFPGLNAAKRRPPKGGRYEGNVKSKGEDVGGTGAAWGAASQAWVPGTACRAPTTAGPCENLLVAEAFSRHANREQSIGDYGDRARAIDFGGKLEDAGGLIWPWLAFFGCAGNGKRFSGRFCAGHRQLSGNALAEFLDPYGRMAGAVIR